jgi:hypothetical protein
MAKNQSLDSGCLESSDFTRKVYVSFTVGATSGNAKKLCDAMLSRNMYLRTDSDGRPVRVYDESHPAHSAKSICDWLKTNFPEQPLTLLATMAKKTVVVWIHPISRETSTCLSWLGPLAETQRNCVTPCSLAIWIYARIVTGAQSGFTMSPTRHTAQNPFAIGSRPTFRNSR